MLFDGSGCIRRFDNVEDILKEFYEYRLDHYQKRKDYLEGFLSAESLKLDNQARFICEKIDGLITIGACQLFLVPLLLLSIAFGLSL